MARRRMSLATRRTRTESQQRIVRETRRRPALVTPSIVETDFAQLGDGSIVEMIEDPEIPSRSMFAVFKNGNVDYVHRVRANKVILVPPSRNSGIVKYVRLPRGQTGCTRVVRLERDRNRSDYR